MKKYLILIIGVILGLRVSAQNAEDFLNKVVEKMKSYNDISIIFNYQMINTGAGLYENENGFASMKGNSYVLNIAGQELISNGEILWTHLIDDEEVMISEVTEDNKTSPIAIVNAFTENISATFIESDDKDITTIEVTENEGDSFDRVYISVDKDMNIKKVYVATPDGNEFIYEITDYKTNLNLPDSMFIFNEEQHPNVEVIDMR